MYLEVSRYDRLTEIILYPYDAFKGPADEQWRTGEAHSNFGTVVLSWPALQESFAHPSDRYHVGYHEFAHVLDRASGRFDGTPVLRDRRLLIDWSKVMSEHFLKLRKGTPRQITALDFYGAENEAEFFAVSTEAYFENPRLLRSKLPRLYTLLEEFFKGPPS